MLTLVTGGTGLVGNNVVRSLLDQGQEVRVLVRQQADPRPLEGLDVERFEGDVRDAEAVRAACNRVAQVVHSAAVVHLGWQGLELQRAVNVGGTRHVAAAARAAGAKMIHVSTVDTIGPGTPEQPGDEETPFREKVSCPYIVTKREAEDVLLELVGQGLEAVIVNPGFMLGPWDWKPSSGRMLIKVAKNLTLLAPPGAASPCDVRDVAAGILAALERGETGRKYILAGYNMPFLEFWQRIKKVTGGVPPRAKLWNGTLNIAGAVGDWLTRLTGREGDVNSAATKLSQMQHCFSSERAARELGYHNRPLQQTVQEAWNWFREHGYA